MNRLETAQYILDTFTSKKRRATEVVFTNEPLSAIIKTDADDVRVNGLFAHRLKSASV